MGALQWERGFPDVVVIVKDVLCGNDDGNRVEIWSRRFEI